MSLFDTLINWGFRQALGTRKGGAVAQTVVPLIDKAAPHVIPQNINDILSAQGLPTGSTGAVALLNTVIDEASRLSAAQKATLKLFVDDMILNGGKL